MPNAFEEKIISALSQFLYERGGSVSSADIGEFHIQHKQLAAHIPNRNVRTFCKKRPQHFAVDDASKGPWRLMLAHTEEEVVDKLARFIAARGGSLRSSQFAAFQSLHPALAQIIYSKGTLRQFCQQHGTFVVEAKPTEPGYTIRLKSSQSNSAWRCCLGFNPV